MRYPLLELHFLSSPWHVKYCLAFMCCSCGSNLGQSEHRKICSCRKRSGAAFSKTTLFDLPASFTGGVSAGTEKNEGTEAKARCWHQAHRS